MNMKKDILKVVAHTQVFGLDIYGTKFTNIYCGKNSLESYFVDKNGWSMSRLKRVVKLLSREGIFTPEKADMSGLYKMGGFRKHFLLMMDAVKFSNKEINI